MCSLCLAWLFHSSTEAFFDLRKAQLFEYTIAHMLDKNFESSLDFLHVLPGAWSCYRYEALQKSRKYKKNILQEYYLKTVLNPEKGETDHKEANMYLAEDRILCLAIFTQVGGNYTLKYIPKAEAKTDAIEDLIEFINQRRRWINSTWFALEYVLRNYYSAVEKSGHNFVTKYIKTNISMLYAYLGKANAYVQLAFIYFIIHFSCFQSLSNEAENTPAFVSSLPGLIPFGYVLLVIFLVLVSLFYKVSSPNLPNVPVDLRRSIRVNRLQHSLNLIGGLGQTIKQIYEIEDRAQLSQILYMILVSLYEKQVRDQMELSHQAELERIQQQLHLLGQRLNNQNMVNSQRGAQDDVPDDQNVSDLHFIQMLAQREIQLREQIEKQKILDLARLGSQNDELDDSQDNQGPEFLNERALQEQLLNYDFNYFHFIELVYYFQQSEKKVKLELIPIRRFRADTSIFRDLRYVHGIIIKEERLASGGQIPLEAHIPQITFKELVNRIENHLFGQSQLDKEISNYEQNLKKFDQQQSINHVFSIISGILGYYYLFIWLLVIYNVFKNYILKEKLTGSLITLGSMMGVSIGSIFFIVLFHLVEPRRVWDIAKSAVSYVFFSGCYTHTLIIFAFCNIDDVGWGTKGIASQLNTGYKKAKLQFVSEWLLTNAIIAFIFVITNQFFEPQSYILYVLGGYASFIMGSRFLFATYYHFKYYLTYYCCCRFRARKQREDIRAMFNANLNDFRINQQQGQGQDENDQLPRVANVQDQNLNHDRGGNQDKTINNPHQIHLEMVDMQPAQEIPKRSAETAFQQNIMGNSHQVEQDLKKPNLNELSNQKPSLNLEYSNQNNQQSPSKQLIDNGSAPQQRAAQDKSMVGPTDQSKKRARGDFTEMQGSRQS